MLNASGFDLSRYQIYASTEECQADTKHSLIHALELYGVDTNNICVFVNGGNAENPSKIVPKKHLKTIARKCGVSICVRYQTPTDAIVTMMYRHPSNPQAPVARLAIIGPGHYIQDVFLYKQKQKVVKTGILILELFSQGLVTPTNRLILNPAPLRIQLDERILEEQATDDWVERPSKTKGVQIWFADIECVTRPHHIPMMYGAYTLGTKPESNCACEGEIDVGCGRGISVPGRYHYVSGGADVEWKGFDKFLSKFPKGRHIVYFHNLKYDWNNIKGATNINIRSITRKDGELYAVTFTFFGRVFELRDSYKFIPKALAEFPEMFGLHDKAKHAFIPYELFTITNTTKDCFVLWHEMRDDDVPEYIYEVSPNGDELLKFSAKDLASQAGDAHPFDPFAVWLANIERTKYIFADNRIALDRKLLALLPKYFTITTSSPPSSNKTCNGNGSEVCGRYYHMAHCEYYLHSDCELLFLGMTKYREIMLEILGIDCHEKLTLPSLVHERMRKIGCYDGVYKLSSNLRAFVDKAICGGRVATRENKMWDVREPIDIIDGVSLYPSAIHRISNPTKEDRGRTPGFPTGKAKIIPLEFLTPSITSDLWHEVPLSFAGFAFYVVEINIHAITIPQQIAFCTYLDDGKRTYSNDPTRMKGIWVDKITLEDWVEFQGIHFEILRGIYWDGAGNTTMGDAIAELFSKKQFYAAQGNIAMSNLYKLSQNALYGKTLSKPSKMKTIIRDKDEALDYLIEHGEEGGSSETYANQAIISMHHEDTEYANYPQVGVLVLAMARRIMNEVMALANSLGIPIYKTDTDSMHIRRNNLLESAFLEKYGRHLIGKGMGQFASELKFPGHTNIFSERALVLGKKVYLHVVVGTDTNGKQNRYYYRRMKGVNQHAMKEYGDDDLALYERLYAGEEIIFDLTYGQAVMFQFKGETITREVYKKRISFRGEKGTNTIPAR